MSVIYRGYQIIPAPLVSISTSFDRDGNGDKTITRTSVNLEGKFIAWKGGITDGAPPDDTPIYEPSGIAQLMAKQNELRDIFSVDGGVFEILGRQGQVLFTCNPDITGEISFQPGVWVQSCEWGVGLSAVTESSGNQLVTDMKDSWNYSESEDNNTISVSHEVSARGVKTTNTDLNPSGFAPVDFARIWVMDRVGYSGASGVYVNTSGWPMDGYNHLKTENKDIYNGTFSITETWLASDQNYIEEFEVSRNDNVTDPWETISINGNITGLRDDDTSHYIAASGAWDTIRNLLYGRCVTYSDASGTISTLPKTITVSKNIDDGIITYNYTYSTEPDPDVPGAEMESVVVRDIDPVDIYASIPVIGRAMGPVLQFMNTYSSYAREVSIELKFDPALYPNYSDKATIDTLVYNNIVVGRGIQPTGTRSVDWLMDDNPSSFDYKKGIYTKNIRWLWNTSI